MGGNVMLPLRGIAEAARGFSTSAPWRLFRLQFPNIGPSHPAETALIRTEQDLRAADAAGFRSAILLGGDLPENGLAKLKEFVVLPDHFSYLGEGDVLGFKPATRHLRTLYRRRSAHNFFFVTERCNHYCLMCSQPPRNVEDGWLLDEIEAAIELVSPETRSFAFTGGEPLLEWGKLVRVLARCRDLLPKTAVHVLTNGRAFARTDVAKGWADIGHPQLMAGIPVYAAVDHIHDYVVQAKGAFDETLVGILKLKDRGQRVEIRVVLHAITAPRIIETCRWLARNFAFVDHVALMGLENTGFTLANSDLLWIDPVDYRDQLAEAVHILSDARVPVSIYNLPRCVLARSVWPFAVQSISDWKNGYADACVHCVERPRCAGFFTSGRPKWSRGIEPILETDFIAEQQA